jgi:sterol desaturase/sphingolipid hydroxylase (fatty acid hydroxylase superfamily)
MIAHFIDWFGIAQGWLFETIIEPLIYSTGAGAYIEDAFEGTEWFLVGLLEVAALYIILRPLESIIPVHKIEDPRARWTDFIYTMVQRLGLFSIAAFFTLDPVMDSVSGMLRMDGVHPFNLESLLPGTSGMSGIASFLVYLVVLDFFEYWYHRAQHGIRQGWALHSLHHSQRDMNLWSDNRNHLLDDVIHDIYLAVIALAIGVAPSQYVLLVSVSRALQSLQHANVRIHFGWLGERLLVSPRFHRMHHAIGIGHESKGKGSLGGCNFGVLLPWWDIAFRSANFTPQYATTGIRDQLAGRDYGRGFWRQQWLGFARLAATFRRRRAP